MVKFLIIEYRVCNIDICLGQSNFLCFFQSNIGRRFAVFRVGRVIIIIVNGHDIGRKAQSFHRLPGAGAHILQEIIAGEHRSWLQLQDDVFFVAVDIVHKVTRFIDFYNQIPQDGLTIFPDIIRIGVHNALSIVVQTRQGGNLAVPVIFNLNFRIDAQGENARFL